MNSSNKKTLIILIGVLVLLCSVALACGAGVLVWWRGAQESGVATVFAPTATPTPFGQHVPVTPESSGSLPLVPDALKRVTPGATTAPAEEQDASRGGTLRLAGDLPPTLDPALVQDSTSAMMVVHLFSGLVSLDASLEIVPDLALGWEMEDGERTYVFDLDPAAAFADGTPITAREIIYSWERALSADLGSPVALTYLGDIVGAQAYATGEADSIAGLEMRDTHTLAVMIDAPKAYFLAKLSYPVAFAVDRTRIERDGSQWILDPNGSGPFMLGEISQSRIVFERNERYVGRLAYVDSVELIVAGGSPMTMYENDELDLVGVWAGELDRVMDPYNPLSAELHVLPELSTEYLGMDVAQSPFDDPAVRLAILKAIDREKLAGLVLNNSVVAARGILPPGLVAEDPDPARDLMAYDPEEARRLLAGSRYAAEGQMPPVVLSISGTSGYMPDSTRAILAMLEDNLGLQVTVEQIDWPDFLTDLNRREYAFYESGWIADYPDPQNFLDMLFHSASAQNHLGYANPEVDALLERARTEQDHDARMALYLQAERLILQDAPWVPLTHGVSFTLVKPWVGGYQAGAGLYPWLKDVYLTR